MNAPSLPAGPFRPDLLPDFAPLREVFRRAGYTEAALAKLFQGRNEQNVDLPVALLRTEASTSFNTLARLFALHLVVAEDGLRAAVAPVNLEQLFDTGMIERVPDGVRATAQLSPWQELLLLNDFLPPEGEPMPADFVMSGASPSSASLAALTVRRRVASALDLGTGSGSQALLLAAHAERVVATDANPRALNFTQMNARLNGIENVSVAEGSFFEPVAGERFDLIVCNPPFIVAPPSDLLFQGNSVGRDAVSERIVREAPAYLNEGGYAISLVSWPHGGGEDWPARPRAWASGTGCDAWVLRGSDDDPLSYAADALRQTEPVRSERYATMLSVWLAYYRAQNFVRLAMGAVLLRKRAGVRNWINFDVIPKAMHGNASDQIERIFAAADLLASIDRDEQLFERRLALHTGHVIEQELLVKHDGWGIQAASLAAMHGIGFRATLDGPVLTFLAQCDGTRTLREAITAVAEGFEMDFPQVAEAALPVVRRMLRNGMLVVS